MQVPCFRALTFEPLTLQVFRKDLFILIVTFDFAGATWATDASMHADVALFPLATTHGLGLQSAIEVAPSPLKVRAGQTIAAAGAAIAASAMQLVEPVLDWLNPG